jgi:hypothetical protein
VNRFFDGPFTAPPPSGPASPPANIVEAVPLLPAVLELPDPPLPVQRDWSWRASDPNPPGGGSNRWGPVDAELLEAAWTPAADATIRALIEAEAWRWPSYAYMSLAARHPELLAEIHARALRHPPHPRATELMADEWVTSACSLGLHSRYRALVPWPDPEATTCAVCGRLFAPETLSGWMFRYGPPRYCPACLCRAINGLDAAVSAFEAATALQVAVRELEMIVPQGFAQKADLGAITDVARRDRCVAALVCLPTVDRLADAFSVEAGRGRWLRILQAAGVVGDAWRPARGTYCIAVDGHACRSLAERTIDDWLHAHGIEHEPEPAWPAHPELNPDGRLCADWRLGDGTFVEYAGMLEDAAYAAKIAAKVELAEATGIRLVVVTAGDLHELGQLLRSDR